MRPKWRCFISTLALKMLFNSLVFKQFMETHGLAVCEFNFILFFSPLKAHKMFCAMFKPIHMLFEDKNNTNNFLKIFLKGKPFSVGFQPKILKDSAIETN